MKWNKPNGAILTSNDSKETIAYCEKLGLKRAKRKYTKKEPPPEVADPVADEQPENGE